MSYLQREADGLRRSRIVDLTLTAMGSVGGGGTYLRVCTPVDVGGTLPGGECGQTRSEEHGVEAGSLAAPLAFGSQSRLICVSRTHRHQDGQSRERGVGGVAVTMSEPSPETAQRFSVGLVATVLVGSGPSGSPRI